jgi:hypothetical protein
MATRSWTELFFLDEATALAAGHRPCFYCRRADAEAFGAAWQRGNGGARVSAKAIDATLHAERLDGRAKRLHPLHCAIEDLPDGAMLLTREVAADDDAAVHRRESNSYLIVRGRTLRWSFDGYRAANATLRDATLLTPPSTLRALQAGYIAVLHPSATSSAAD